MTFIIHKKNKSLVQYLQNTKKRSKPQVRPVDELNTFNFVIKYNLGYTDVYSYY